MRPYKNNRVLKAIRKEPLDYTPIWIMRQAGRYLPEYRATRAHAGSFTHLCKTPALACEVTLQPIQRFDLDAAIIFSDILTIPDAFGLELTMVEGQGPVFLKPLHRDKDFSQIREVDDLDLSYVYEAIRLVCHELNGRIPLIGFCGSPWTLAQYMIEGKGQKGFPRAQQWRRDHPAQLHRLLETLSLAVAKHLIAQAEAGAGILMIFDTWGALLADDEYERFSLYYLKEIINLIRAYYNNSNDQVPIILFRKETQSCLEQLAGTGCEAIGVDWHLNLNEARQRVGDRVALQGNMHPTMLLNSPHEIEAEVKQILASYGQGTGHIFNLGHGITPDVPPEHVAVLVNAVHELSRPYHQMT